MPTRILLIALLVGLGLLLTAVSTAQTAAPAKKRNIVVLTGGHGFDAKAFPKLFEGFDDITAKIVAQKNGDEIFQDVSGWSYDTIVLYNFNQKMNETGQKNFLALLEKGVGLVVLHHAIVGYQDWPEFNKIIGARYYLKDETGPDGTVYKRCTWKDDVDYKVRVEDAAHPITAGVKDFEINDEVYKGYTVFPEAKVLLATDEPLNNKNIGWWKTYAKANVVYLQLGHGPRAYENKSFRQLLGNAIRWAGR